MLFIILINIGVSAPNIIFQGESLNRNRPKDIFTINGLIIRHVENSISISNRLYHLISFHISIELLVVSHNRTAA